MEDCVECGHSMDYIDVFTKGIKTGEAWHCPNCGEIQVEMEIIKKDLGGQNEKS